MTSGELATLLSDLLKIPFSTLDLYGRRLREAELLSVKGHGRGAAAMTPSDAATWLISICIAHERGGDFIKEVQRVRSLPLLDGIVLSQSLIDGMLFPATKTAGKALEAIILDTQRSEIAARLKAKDDRCLNVNFDADGAFVSVFMANGEPAAFESGIWTYQRGERRRQMIETTTTIHGHVLYQIGKGVAPSAS